MKSVKKRQELPTGVFSPPEYKKTVTSRITLPVLFDRISNTFDLGFVIEKRTGEQFPLDTNKDPSDDISRTSSVHNTSVDDFYGSIPDNTTNQEQREKNKKSTMLYSLSQRHIKRAEQLAKLGVPNLTLVFTPTMQRGQIVTSKKLCAGFKVDMAHLEQHVSKYVIPTQPIVSKIPFNKDHMFDPKITFNPYMQHAIQHIGSMCCDRCKNVIQNHTTVHEGLTKTVTSSSSSTIGSSPSPVLQDTRQESQKNNNNNNNNNNINLYQQNNVFFDKSRVPPDPTPSPPSSIKMTTETTTSLPRIASMSMSPSPSTPRNTKRSVVDVQDGMQK